MTDTLERFRVAAIQFNPVLGAKEENLVRLLELTEQAARAGARLVVLPEMATTGYCWYDRDEVAPMVEPIPGPTTDRFEHVARSHDCYVVVGLAEVEPATDIFYNSAALVGPEGVVGVYRKTHSYISEPKWAKDGDRGLPCWETPLGRIGIVICQDADFFEPARIVALQGADILCFPTNWLGEKSPGAPWLARAFENGCYLIAANRSDNERFVQFSGGSAVINPDGSIQSRHDNSEAIVYGDVSLTEARHKAFAGSSAPDKVTARRPELYHNMTLNTYLWNPYEFHGLYGHRPLPPGRRSTVAAAQMAPLLGDPAANLATVARLLSQIESDVEMVVFPEYALTGCPRGAAEAEAIAQPRDATGLDALAALAAQHQATLVAGFVERAGSDLYSTAICVQPDGTRTWYRKTHPVGEERAWCRPGEERPPILDLPLGRVGLLLGSDLCFPEIVRSLAIDGCDLIAVPAGPGVPPVMGLGPTSVPLEPPVIVEADPLHFHLGRQRATENVCYLVFASLPAPAGIGHSGVFGPTFESRAEEQILGQEVEGIAIGHIDTTNLDTEYPTNPVRAKHNVRMRQPYLYDLLQIPEPPALSFCGPEVEAAPDNAIRPVAHVQGQ